jgi:DNA-binding response OmpR family regulator
MVDMARILVVDDEQDICDLEELMLTRAGYAVDIVLDGPAALERLGRESYDLVILDVMMPQMDGYEVCRRIKADPSIAELPVLFLTARDEPRALLKGFESGGAMYISKPFSEDKLLAMVAALLGPLAEGRAE